MSIIQYGVLPYVLRDNKVKLVLVTSRKSNKWIVPKGNRLLHKSKHATALQEAYEEAGIRGKLHKNEEMSFTIKSHGKQVKLYLYLMRVDEMLTNWPEQSERKRILVARQTAAKIVGWPNLSSKLKSLNINELTSL